MSIAKAGDEVILPRPHYFNHDMWLRMQGVTPATQWGYSLYEFEVYGTPISAGTASPSSYAGHRQP